ncbi:MAG: OmpH family outer membrane protein, partial [Nitrosopumilus sp.]|nr:OmpH family outer membrane protein [Nitrosopumilus sp.]
MQKFLLSTMTVIVLLTSGLATAKGVKVGTVDFKEVNREINFSAKVRSAYEERMKGVQTEVQTLRKQLSDLRKNQKKEGEKWTDAEKEKNELALTKTKDLLTKKQAEAKKQSTNIRTEVTSEFQDILTKSVERIAKENGISMVFQKGTIFYGDNTQDVTASVITELKHNKRLK